MVFPIGVLGIDFGTRAHLLSMGERMGGAPNPRDFQHLAPYLLERPADAAELIWTLNLDAETNPIYAIMPAGPFARDGYELLVRILLEQVEEGVTHVSMPGVISGSTRLMSGQIVPTIVPSVRGVHSWSIPALVEAVCGASPAENASKATKDGYSRKLESVANCVTRLTDEVRSLGNTPEERARNCAATNALNVGQVIDSALREKLALDTITEERIASPAGSDYWDVKLTFFNPIESSSSRKVYRITVDIADVCPVMVGRVRSWYIR